MDKIVKFLIESYSPSYTTYRFSSASNFVSYEDYCEELAIEEIIRLGEQLKREKFFKKYSNEELMAFIEEGHSVARHENYSHCTNQKFLETRGWDAKKELDRRKFHEARR
jgi:hypothetical protein